MVQEQTHTTKILQHQRLKVLRQLQMKKQGRKISKLNSQAIMRLL
jgi:hypothetical protein